MKVYDYRIVEKLDVNTMKPHFIIEKYNLTAREHNPYSFHPFQTLREAQEAIRLLRKYNEPVYHYVK